LTVVPPGRPSSAGRTRGPLSSSVIDSISELVTQLALFLLVFFISDVDLVLSTNTDELSGAATTALAVAAALVVAAALCFAIPPLRARLITALAEARDALRVLRKLAQLYGGNLLSQLLFAVALGACVRAFGYQVPLSSLILINTVVSLFAGLLPIPGGVGASEAGLSLGLTRVGLPAEITLAIALAYRFATFYLPPHLGLRQLPLDDLPPLPLTADRNVRSGHALSGEPGDPRACSPVTVAGCALDDSWQRQVSVRCTWSRSAVARLAVSGVHGPNGMAADERVARTRTAWARRCDARSSRAASNRDFLTPAPSVTIPPGAVYRQDLRQEHGRPPGLLKAHPIDGIPRRVRRG